MGELTKEQKKTLMALGFVNVTGLPTHNPFNRSWGVIKSEMHWLGKYGSNNGMTAIHTMRGQVFLREGYVPKEDGERLRMLHEQLCPNCIGANVPCSNGEFIANANCKNGSVIPASLLIMRRLVNPDETFDGQITASAMDHLPTAIIPNQAA
jgi:hypothetical protein